MAPDHPRVRSDGSGMTFSEAMKRHSKCYICGAKAVRVFTPGNYPCCFAEDCKQKIEAIIHIMRTEK